MDGALGFLPIVDESSPNGNYGIFDQRFALEWVKDNIVAFGGDSSMVTIVGQSVGAQSVAIHLTTPRSQQLFHRAIMESCPLGGIRFLTKREAQIQASDLMTYLGCINTNELECMRSKSADDILNAQYSIIQNQKLMDYTQPWGPYLDGNDIVKQIAQSFLDDDYQNKPIIMGFVADDARDSLYRLFPQPMNETQFSGFFSKMMIGKSTDIFHPSENNDYRDIASQLLLLYTFACPIKYISQHLSLANISIWNYVFDHPFSFDGWDPELTYCTNYSCHCVELPFLFHSVTLIGLNYSNDEEILAYSLIQYWGLLKISLDPAVYMEEVVIVTSYLMYVNLFIDYPGDE
ncbi:cAMP-regulated D2 protein-like [Saccoglossus kowalevskii]